MNKNTKSTSPLVSVIIPVYNGGITLSETIDSVLSQSYPNIEILVVNDGSTDSTNEVLAKYKDKVVCLNKENGGLASARNYGMKHTKGDYIVWLDADDILEKDKISIQLHFMEMNSKIVLSCTDFSAFNDSGIFDRSHIKNYYGSISRIKNGFDGIYNNKTQISLVHIQNIINKDIEDISVYYGDISEKLIFGNIIHPPTVMFRRSISEQLNGLDPTLGEGTDYDYFIRFSRLGKIAYINFPLLRYRYSENQMSADTNLDSILASACKVLEKTAKENPQFIAENKQLFNNRISQVYISAARYKANNSIVQPLGLIWKAIKHGYYKPNIILIIVKALTPKTLISLRRTHTNIK